jgi:formylglycine-generating enzyme required for sulfatase activity
MPVRKIQLSSYYIDRYELTWRQYARFCSETGHPLPPRPQYPVDENHPVVNVSWQDARKYAEWAGRRLPTEAEWEKAARGGFKIPAWEPAHAPIASAANAYPRRSYPWGEEAPCGVEHFRCNYVAYDHWQRRGEDGYAYTAPVGSFGIGDSPYGCADMAGNVWEWCMDSYREDFYLAGPSRDPVCEDFANRPLRVVRGGSWFNFAESCRTTKRYKAAYDDRLPWIGIRLAR